MKVLSVLWCAALFCGLSLSPVGIRAEEPKTPPAKESPKSEADKKDEPVADPFAAPVNADSNMLVAFCKNLFMLRKNVKTRAEFTQYQSKLFPAVREACEKILALEKSDATENGRFARRNLLSMDMKYLMTGTPEQVKTYLASLQKFAEAGPLARDDVGMIAQTIQGVEHTQGEKGKDFITAMAALMKKSKDEKIVEYAGTLEGTVRRLSLVGNTMDLKGTTVEGKPFDLASFKGKVVLVDFWATWCGPCRAELPNVKKNYEGYHSKGFEVVGISGDQDRTALDAFLEKDKLPWTTLHDNNGHNAAMDTYGISAFPTTLLVGKDGKVLALSARGPALGELLKAQLGEPVEPPPAPANPAPSTPAAPPATK